MKANKDKSLYSYTKYVKNNPKAAKIVSQKITELISSSLIYSSR